MVVEAPAFPKINQLAAWKTRVGHALVAAANSNEQKECRWFLERSTSSFDDVDICKSEPRLRTLGGPLVQALYKTCPSVLQARISDHETNVVDGKPPSLLTGRQTAWMIIELFKTERRRTSFTSYSDLQSLPWLGDTPTNMEDFLRNWDYLLNESDMPSLPEDQLRNLFYGQYKESKVLAHHAPHYQRERAMAEPGEAYSIGFLRRTIEMHILDQRTEHILADMRKAFQKGMAGSVPKAGACPALPTPSPKTATGRGKGGTESKGKCKGEDKGKGKGAKGDKGGGNAGKSRTLTGGQSPCWYDNRNHHRRTPPCKFGDKCLFEHKSVGFAIFQSMAPPRAGSDSDATSVAAGMSSSPSTADDSKKNNPYVRHSIGFRNGTCAKTDGNLPHLCKAHIAQEKKRLREANATDATAAVATSTATAKPKAKAKAPCRSLHPIKWEPIGSAHWALRRSQKMR